MVSDIGPCQNDSKIGAKFYTSQPNLKTDYILILVHIITIGALVTTNGHGYLGKDTAVSKKVACTTNYKAG